MKTIRRIASLASAFVLLAAAKGHASRAVPAAYPDAVTHHVLTLRGQRIPYTARAGTIELHDPKTNAVTARMFYVAYTKEGANPSTRPLTFFYNGGPGSSTIWLHMGSVGPVRVRVVNGAPTGPAPYHLLQNQDSILDRTDEVFVDAPDTGYSRIIGAGKPDDFFGVDQDGRAFTQFIERYITKFSRWNSPKFLFGESYGTTRDCVLVDDLQKAGVEMSGVVLQSSILNFNLGGLLGGDPIAGGDWGYVLYLPTEAATAWYHHKANTRLGLAAFLNEVQQFAGTTYLRDLARGASLSPAEFNGVVARLHDYLGLSESYIRDSNLRINYPRYEKQLLRSENTIVGRYDSRYQTFDIDQMANEPSWDPSDVGITGAYVAALQQYMHGVLHYNPPIPYRTEINVFNEWDWKHNGDDPPTNVTPDLAEAMSTNPHLHVFSANGYYDFATPYFETEYTLDHLGIAPSLQKNITFGNYPSGHMLYLNPQTLAAYRSDLEKWYSSTAP
jgi:carboxypeptidase C (cathepsin A)